MWNELNLHASTEHEFKIITAIEPQKLPSEQQHRDRQLQQQQHIDKMLLKEEPPALLTHLLEIGTWVSNQFRAIH